jgi:hypothetical protein
MAIATLQGLLDAPKQVIDYRQTSANWSGTAWASVIGGNAVSGWGTVANDPTSTTAGVVPTSADAGYPVFDAWGGSAKGYVSGVTLYDANLNNNGGFFFQIVDHIYRFGNFNFGAGATASSPPSFASRVPNTDYALVRGFIRIATTFVGTPSFSVTYLDETGTSQTVTVAGTSGVAAKVMIPIPLAAGTRGISQLVSVTENSGATTAGAYCVEFIREVCQLGRGKYGGWNGDGLRRSVLNIGFQEISSSAALLLMGFARSGLTTVALDIEIANG